MTEIVTTAFGDRIALDRYGDGPSIVFVAGAGPHRAIDPVTSETAQIVAARRFRTVVYDRPGRGESAATGEIGLDRDLAALDAVIATTGAPAVLCGHSSGCAISLRAAVDGLPVSGLVLWEAPLAADAADTAEWAARFERLLDAGDPASAIDEYMRDMPPEWLAELKASPLWAGIVAGAPSQRADAQALAWATAVLAAGGFTGITSPVLAVYGTTTFDEMPIAAEAIRSAVPDGRTVAVAGAEHGWDAAAMADALVAFTAGLRPIEEQRDG